MKLNSAVALWQHQQEGQQRVTSNAETLLLGDCGVGKTLMTLAAASNGGFRRNIIITIKPALWSVWDREIRTHTDTEPLILAKGTTQEKRELLEKEYAERRDLTVVVNYETARLLRLGDFQWDFAVTDESHRVKAHNSSVSNQLAAELQNVDCKLAMTGTAWDDRPTDVFGQARWLAPRRAGNYWASERLGTWTSFFERYVIYREVDHIKLPIKYKNLDELEDRISPIFLYIGRDRLPELPPVRHINRMVALSPKHMKAYRELEKELTTRKLGDLITVDSQMVVKLRLHQIAGGFYQPDDASAPQPIAGGDAKLDELVGIAEELGNEPFVIFTRFREDVDRIRATLTKMGVTSSEISGRQDDHRLWVAGDSQCLVANIQAGSAAINLTRAAYAILYSTGYSNTDYTQALYRLDRPGQTRKVTFYHILAQGTVDEEIQQQLGTKTTTRDDLLERFKDARQARIPSSGVRRVLRSFRSPGSKS